MHDIMYYTHCIIMMYVLGKLNSTVTQTVLAAKV